MIKNFFNYLIGAISVMFAGILLWYHPIDTLIIAGVLFIIFLLDIP